LRVGVDFWLRREHLFNLGFILLIALALLSFPRFILRRRLCEVTDALMRKGLSNKESN
jgi:hypothetical protein